MIHRAHAQPILAARRRALPPFLGWLGLAALLLALFSLATSAAPAVLDRAVDAPDAGRVFYGLGAVEQGDGGAFRWSGELWGIVLFGLVRPGPVQVTIEASAARPDGQPPATLEVDDGSPYGAKLSVARGWRTYQLVLDPTLITNEYQIVELKSSTFVPPGEGGARRLGVAVRRVEVRQLPQPGGWPIAPRALFLTCATLLAAAALRQSGRAVAGADAADRAGWRAALSGAAGWPGLGLAGGLALGALLGALQLYQAPALGYWLPNTWTLLGMGALALALFPALGWLERGLQAVNRPRAALALGLGLSLAGALALWLAAPAWAGMPAALGGAALATAALRQLPARDLTTEPGAPSLRATWLLLVGATLVALALRLYRINSLPIAVWRDEVYHGLVAQAIWRDPSYRPIYVPEVDLPALLFYLQAPLVGLFGADLWTLRLAPALAGSLTPLAGWFALRPIVGPRGALAAAWWLAAAAWDLYMSRWGFPVIFDPLLTLLAVGCVWRGLASGVKPWRAIGLLALAGMCAGLAVYTYHTGRIEPLIVGAVGLVRLWRTRRPAKLPAIAAGALAFGLTIAPLAGYALTHPEDFSKRIDDVSIFGRPHRAVLPPLGPLEENLARYALMWHVAGDQNPRHFAPGRPVLDPVAGVLMLLGLGVCLRVRPSTAGVATLIWLGAGVVPGVFSDAAPHAMRSIGALAPTCALIAIGLGALLRAYGDAPPRLVRMVVAGALLAAMAWQATVYFRTTSDQREMFNMFETTVTVLVRGARTAVAATTPSGARYQAYLWDVNTAGKVAPFLIGAEPVGRFDGAALIPPAGPRALVLLAGDAPPAIRQRVLALLGPGARLLRTGALRPYTSNPIYVIYGAGPEAQWLADQLPLP
jgi:4-amino-4-deoxy-L-arabinose transferase-like glycosyltransferase